MGDGIPAVLLLLEEDDGRGKVVRRGGVSLGGERRGWCRRRKEMFGEEEGEVVE